MGLQCLIVDDSQTFLASATRLLGAQGLDIVGRACSSAEAVRLARELRPDVALVDIELDGTTGFDVARSLSAEVPTAQVVLISTHDQGELASLIAKSRAIGFLQKQALSAEAIAALVRRHAR
jgi:DNA-binding NarL/FixJ family response regulator